MRTCPRCLARNGRWRLEWRLPWSFACLDHVIYLCNRCPRPFPSDHLIVG
ncbi:TniQ family protein [Streptomyces sp. NPDC048491]